MTVLAGRYRLETLLGRGGMGRVWRATDLTLDRTVAVKLVPADFEDDVALARFQREARIAARLGDHPHIVSVHDFGRHREGGNDDAYIVMELVDGRPLSVLTAAGPLEPSKALLFAEHIARALEAAHADGIVHRDVKPANAVLVEKPGRPEAVKVLDFGISSLGEQTAGLTPAGTVMGTPAYIAPEVWNGRPASAASDLYALGAVLFELLTGRPPFVRDNHYAYYVAHLQEPPEPLGAHAPGLPSGVGELIEALLAKDPGARPAAAADVADSLTALRRSFAGREGANGPAVGAAAAPAALGSTAGGATPWHAVPRLPAQRSEPDAGGPPGGTSGVDGWLSRVADADNTDGASFMHHHGQLLRKLGDVDSARTWWTRAAEAGNAEAMDGLGILCRAAGDTDGAVLWWLRAAEAGNTDAMDELADLYRAEDDTATAVTWWTRAADAGNTDAMYNLGRLLHQRGDAAAARLWWARAGEAGDAYAMNRLGFLHQAQADVEGARTWWARAADAGDADAAYHLGGLLHERGDLDGARVWWTRAAEAGIRAYAMFVFGTLLREQGDTDEAHTWLSRAAEGGNTQAMSDLAELLRQQGDHRRARAWHTRAAEAGHPDGGPGRPS